MANISSIKLPDGDTYNLKDILSCPYIVGTQTAATNAWTGVAPFATLSTGQEIRYYLPYAGNSSAATLNLTLPDGTTTGAKGIRRIGSSTVTTHFAAGNVIYLTYDGTYWKVSAYYDSNSNTVPTGYCTTAAATAKKSVTCTYGYRDDTTYFPCVFSYANTAANATLAISTYATTELPIYVNGARTTSSNTFGRGVVMFLYYNNAYYCYNDGRFPIVVNEEVTSIQDVLTSKSAESGGTALSLVTTGEKYTWNNKSDLIIGTTATTAAAGNHTHTASLATDSGTSAITLASAGKYKLTAGGSSVIFTMPTIPTVSYPVTSVNSKTGAVSLTASDVGAAASSHAHGNITSDGDITATAPTIASGDQIVINDSSASKITNGPTFDGSTTTTALTPKGTWESFSKFSGSYNDLTNKPTIPTVNNATLTIQKNGTTVKTFTANASSDVTANITVPTNVSELTNDSGFISSYTDNKVSTAAVTNNTTYYPIVGTSTTSAETKFYDSTGFKYDAFTGTTESQGGAELILGNNTGAGTAGNKRGIITLYGTGTNATTLYGPPSGTASHNVWLPDDGGTIALTTDIPSSMSGTTASNTTGITASTTATKTTLGTAFTIPNVTSVGSASSWVFESIACDDITSWSAGSGSFTQGSFSGGSGSFTATVTDHVLSFSHTHTAATHGADSHTHTNPSLSYTARTVYSKKSGSNGSAPTLGTAFTVPNVTGNSTGTVSVTDNGHTHTVSVN